MESMNGGFHGMCNPNLEQRGQKDHEMMWKEHPKKVGQTD